MKQLKIGIASDHAGFQLKKEIMAHLQKHTITDFGTDGENSVDYPDFAHPLSQAVAENKLDWGILICGSGNGMAITANKYAHVRAALCWSDEITALARQHNDANILCLPARFISVELAIKMVDTFLNTEFEGGRHANRIAKMSC